MYPTLLPRSNEVVCTRSIQLCACLYCGDPRAPALLKVHVARGPLEALPRASNPSVPMPLQVMYRERAAGMYDELPFAVAQCLVEIPYNLVQSVLFAIISYWMLGFENNAGAA